MALPHILAGGAREQRGEGRLLVTVEHVDAEVVDRLHPEDARRVVALEVVRRETDRVDVGRDVLDGERSIRDQALRPDLTVCIGGDAAYGRER